jgi:hypothetical protein
LKVILHYNKNFSFQSCKKKNLFKKIEPIVMLYLIGLGLGDEKDITIKGLEAIDKCDILYLEHYTSILTVGKEKLEKFYSSQLKKEVQIILADRELIESECDEKIIEKSKKQNVGVLIVGDPFGATTHADIMVRAKQLGIEVGVVHNASIMFELFSNIFSKECNWSLWFTTLQIWTNCFHCIFHRNLETRFILRLCQRKFNIRPSHFVIYFF